MSLTVYWVSDIIQALRRLPSAGRERVAPGFYTREVLVPHIPEALQWGRYTLRETGGLGAGQPRMWGAMGSAGPGWATSLFSIPA